MYFFSQYSFSFLDNKNINISTGRNLEFLTTFPSGDKIGYDIKSKKVINTFKIKKGSNYFLEAESETDPAEERHKILSIDEIFPGKYQIVFYSEVSLEKEIAVVIDNMKRIGSGFIIGYSFLWRYRASFKKDIPLEILFEIKNHDNNAIEVSVTDEFGKFIPGSVLTKTRGLKVIQETKY